MIQCSHDVVDIHTRIGLYCEAAMRICLISGIQSCKKITHLISATAQDKIGGLYTLYGAIILGKDYFLLRLLFIASTDNK